VWTSSNPPTNLLASIGDPDGTRTVTSIAGLLVALGLALVMIAFWMWRTTRPDPELLAPLEAMGERKWRRADPVAQRRTLDAVRPEGAEPLTPSAAPPVLDQTFDAGPSATGFDDLHADDEPEVGNIRSVRRGQPSWAAPAGEVTPRQIERPEVDVFEHDIDPEILAAADAELEAELEAELNGSSDREPDADTDAADDPGATLMDAPTGDAVHGVGVPIPSEADAD